MQAQTPGVLHALFIEAMNEGKLEDLVQLYEPEAIFVVEQGKSVRGIEAIREALAGFLRQNPTIEMTTRGVYLAPGGLALLEGSWTLRGTGPDGSAYEARGESSEVARRQADGTWRYIIDDPGVGRGQPAAPEK